MWNVGIIQTDSKSKSSIIDKAGTKSFSVTYSGCHINTTYVCKTTMKDGTGGGQFMTRIYTCKFTTGQKGKRGGGWGV